MTSWSLTLDPLPNSTQKCPNRAKSNYSFHWKLKENRTLILTYLDSQMAIFDFGYLQVVNWVKVSTKNWNFGYIPCLFIKIQFFQNALNMYLYNYGGLPVVRIFQLYLMFFTGVIIPTPPPFMGLNGPNWAQKVFLFNFTRNLWFFWTLELTLFDIPKNVGFVEILVFSNNFSFTAVNWPPKWNKTANFGGLPFTLKFRILKDFSKTVFLLLETTSS